MIRLAALVAILAVLAAVPAGAQTTASILGTVTDESAALVAGAKVRAINTLTNELRNSVTDAGGYYRFAELPVGVYTVQVEFEGFKTAIREGIELSLGRNARVDMQLSLGALTERVSVVADAPLVEATTNEMGVLVSQRRVVELPLNGRNTLSLVSLIPGAQTLQTGNAQGFVENRVSINGAREEDSNWMLDGGDNTSPLRNYGNDVPNPDAVQEFRVVSSNYSAEYGRTVGAVINVVTRSGTNEFHGSAFQFLRNRSLNARDFFEPDTSPLVQNQFGGSAGGRIIPNKTFFFGSFQGFRRRTSDFRNNALVPTAAERSGDFSRSVDRTGRPVVVRDPRTSQPFPGSIIPSNRLSPIALGYLKVAAPLPNDPGRGPNSLTQRASHPRDNDQFLTKIDHLLSERHKISGAYFWSDTIDGERFVGDTDFAWRDIKSRQQNLNIHEFWTISPTKLNHFRATYTRSAGDRKVMPDNLTMADLGSKWSPLPDGPKMPPDFEVVGWFDNGTSNGGPKYANHYTLANTFDWVKGRHELKFGAEGWMQRMTDVSTAPRVGGSFTFDGSVTGNSVSDLLLGQVRTLDVGAQTYKSQNSWVAQSFFQDKLRVNRKLILNLGLRYELSTWPVHPLNALIAIVPGRKSTCVPQAPTNLVFPCDEGVPRAGVKDDFNNFAPRFGIAYDVAGDGKTVIRGGYGISYAFSYFNASQEQQVSVPFQLRATIRNTTLDDPYAPYAGGNPFPFRSDPGHLIFASGGSYGFQDFNMRTGYIQQFNLSVQRQIGADWSGELAYVGNLGRKLMGQIDYNAPLRTANDTRNNVDARRPWAPDYRDMRMTGGFVNSSYNALQARLERRFRKGLTVLSSYTFGKSLDESSWYSSRNEWADTYNRWLNKGRGDYDRRHLAALSWVWEVPGLGSTNRVARALAAGWSINGIATFQSGGPLFIITNTDNDFDGNSSGDRPDVVGAWNLSPSRLRAETIAQWFNPRAFVANTPGKLGNLGRNVVEGPGTKNVDLGVTRLFRIREGHQVQLRAEAFNLCNWVNLEDPEVRFSSGIFGTVTGARDPRIYQFGLRYTF